jgi:hypothetical protein
MGPDLTIQKIFERLSMTYTDKTEENISTFAASRRVRQGFVGILPAWLQEKDS